MGRNGLAQLLRYTILDSFVSKIACESCRPKTEALEEAFWGGGWGGFGRSWVNFGVINRSHMLRSKLKAEKVVPETRWGEVTRR